MHDAPDAAWTQLPGDRLASGDGEHRGKKVATIPCRRLEFVMTNGVGKFDTPNPYGETDKPKNYVIDMPGMYELKSGKVHRVA